MFPCCTAPRVQILLCFLVSCCVHLCIVTLLLFVTAIVGSLGRDLAVGHDVE